MDFKKALILLAISALAYAFFYRAPEVDYGQYSGSPQNAPTLAGDEVIGHLRIYQNLGNYSAGHGFVLSHKAQSYVVSASHVVNDLASVNGVDVVAGTATLVAGAQPALGASYSTCDMQDAKRDVIFFRPRARFSGGDLLIAVNPPQIGQNVWLLCTQDNTGANKLLIPALVTSSTSRALKYQLLTRTSFNGTSGCPIINSDKQFVGVNVCGHAEAGVAVPIATVLDSLNSI